MKSKTPTFAVCQLGVLSLVQLLPTKPLGQLHLLLVQVVQEEGLLSEVCILCRYKLNLEFTN